MNRVHYISENGSEEVRAIVTDKAAYIEVRRDNIVVRSGKITPAKLIYNNKDKYIRVEQHQRAFTLFRTGYLSAAINNYNGIMVNVPKDVTNNLFELFNEYNQG